MGLVGRHVEAELFCKEFGFTSLGKIKPFEEREFGSPNVSQFQMWHGLLGCVWHGGVAGSFDGWKSGSINLQILCILFILSIAISFAYTLLQGSQLSWLCVHADTGEILQRGVLIGFIQEDAELSLFDWLAGCFIFSCCWFSALQMILEFGWAAEFLVAS